jgi:hypothetical protein
VDPDPFIRGTDPDLLSRKNDMKNLDSYCFVTSLYFLSYKNYVNVPSKSNKSKNLDIRYNQAVLRIRIRIWIHMFLGLLDPDPDPLVRGMDPDPDTALDPDRDPSIIMQK